MPACTAATGYLLENPKSLTPGARAAKLVGEALAAVRGATLVGTIVMASAASRGDTVYTSDLPDLERLRRRFPAVRVLSV